MVALLFQNQSSLCEYNTATITEQTHFERKFAYCVRLQFTSVNPWLAHDVIGSDVGVLNDSKNVFWEFGSIIMQNSSDISLLHQHGLLITSRVQTKNKARCIECRVAGS